MVFQTGALIHQICAASDDRYIHCFACHAGGSDSGYDAWPVSMLLRTRCDPEYLFRNQQLPFCRSGAEGLSRIFFGQELSGRIFSDPFFAGTSRNALSWRPTSVGYRRRRHRRFTALLERFQNSIWPCINLSIPGWTYVDCEKDNAHFSSDNSIVHTTLLCAVVQRI